ncbi:hypothetical protein HID58_086648 [Brassica napus]|uniref:Uncharacterized protein n=1 Tax=Brassica napus TaxID=3708 RepID=A0ABQ7XSX0_BRANA|nr:hypothetical protein HID58_086648 [Brassica napus]
MPYRLLEEATGSSSEGESTPVDAVIFVGMSLVLGIASMHLLRGTRVPYTVALVVIGIALGSPEYGTYHNLRKVGHGIRIRQSLSPIDSCKLVEDSMVKLDKICREANVKVVFIRSYGLVGLVRVSVKHTIIDSKPDHFLDELRLNNPWPELKSHSHPHVSLRFSI